MTTYDCIIAGAGLSGFAAAVGAVQAGAKVLLIDKMAAPGGSAVYAMTPVLSGWQSFGIGNAAGKILADELQKINAFEWRVSKIVTDEDSLQQAMGNVLKRLNVDTLFSASLCGVDKEDDKITSISVMTIGGVKKFSAKNFVDATGDAVLSMLAGAELVTPCDEESMTKTLMFKVRNVKDFDRDTVVKLFKENHEHFPVQITDSFMGLPLLDKSEVLINLTAVTGNAADADSYSRMQSELYKQVGPVTDYLRRYIPCFADAVVSKTAPVVGVRYTRSVRGNKSLTLDDIFNPEMPAEPVAFCGNYIGGHYVKQYRSPWGYAVTGNPAVPYGAIQVKGISNLLTAGRIIDADPKVISAVRLAAGCLATGQAAGIAAALGVPEYDELCVELEKQHCLDWLKFKDSAK